MADGTPPTEGRHVGYWPTVIGWWKGAPTMNEIEMRQALREIWIPNLEHAVEELAAEVDPLSLALDDTISVLHGLRRLAEDGR